MLRGLRRPLKRLGETIRGRLIARRREGPAWEAEPHDLPPEWDVFLSEADALGRVFERRRRVPLALAGAAGAVALFAAGFIFHLAFFETSSRGGATDETQAEAQRLLDEVVPAEGFTVDARWGEILPQLVEAGVIDIEKFGATAQRAGSPLTQEQIALLTAPSDEKLRIDRGNTYFMLNVLWAVGLADASLVLSEGPMATYDQRDRLASTAGWTLGLRDGPEYIGSLDLVALTPEQEEMVLHVASHSYRPCCNNPTAFPDCNHGAAALGLAAIMASQGATDEEIFKALKAFNAYWFPEAYYKLAVLFQDQGTEWDDVDAALAVGKDYSSQTGAAAVDAQLRAQGRLPQVQGGAGGSCSQ